MNPKAVVRQQARGSFRLVIVTVLLSTVGCKPNEGTSTSHSKSSENLALLSAPEASEQGVKSSASPGEKASQEEHSLPDGSVPSSRRFDAPFIDSLPEDVSFSIGTASRGYLVNGVAMKEGHPCLKIRTSARNKRAQYGTRDLVDALEQAACIVQRQWPGSLLYAGDLSRETGGDLSGHTSHNSGRDADLAFYMRDRAGRIADSTRMLPIQPDGRAKWGGDLTFDVPRNWAMIEAFLKNPRIQVQYLFVANYIRSLLLDYAKAVGASKDVIRHARAVLKQPNDSSPHVEHFHLRIYCGLKERLEGCLDYGTIHPWTDTYDRQLAGRVGEVLPFLRGNGVEEIEFAITRLVRLRAIAAIEHMVPLKDHAVPRVQRLAREAIAFLRGERTPSKWMHLAEEDAGD